MIRSLAPLATAALLALSGCGSAPTEPPLEFALAEGVIPKGQVLVVLSAANELHLASGEPHPTGLFLSELVHPLETILAAGYEVSFASPGGLIAAIDSDSLSGIYWPGAGGEREAALRRVLASRKLNAPAPLATVDPDAYSGIFVPGGHAPMVDLARSADMARLLRACHEAGRPTAVLCHAPAALLSTLPKEQGDPPWPYAGYEMAIFTNFEEGISEAFFLGGDVPYYIDTELQKAGAKAVSCINPFSPSNAYRDRELITGQNPYSAHECAQLFVEAMDAFRASGSLRKASKQP
tara:strand:- start:125 stop:1006 length:882 start_codon:yes stop_codon:yes gene_type:complete